MHRTGQVAPSAPLRDCLGPCEFRGPETEEGLEVLIKVLT